MSRTGALVLRVLATWIFLTQIIVADQVLKTNGFSNCVPNPSISVTQMDIQFDHSTNTVYFNVAGKSNTVQTVTAFLTISAYGESFNKSFNPCSGEIHVAELCPIPMGSFAARGSWAVPQQYASEIPSIAYTIPNLDGVARVELVSAAGEDVACVESNIGNSKTTYVPGVTYAAGAIAAGALVASGMSIFTVGAGHAAAAHAAGALASPTFIETVHWFQGMAMNGMLSVQYPGVYRDFSKNFGFSVGLLPWDSINTRIDNFRSATGGNLTEDNVQYLRSTNLVFQNPNTPSQATSHSKRSLAASMIDKFALFVRDGISTSVNGSTTTVGSGPTSGGPAAANSQAKPQHYAQGISAYVEQFTVPKGNTFMLVLLIFSIVLAGLTAGILLFKVILESWALFGSFPKKLASFRKNYWWLLAKTITNLIFLLYAVWVLYCIYQFKLGDSWATRALAGVTLVLFTAILLWFTWRIWHKAHLYKKSHGDNSILYEDKETWRKYSIFYDTYKRSYWWVFVPAIIYMFARGCVIALGDGHGFAQTAAQLIIDSTFLLLLLFLRPYNRGSGNWINIIIQVVRVISLVCILVFVEELGMSQTTQTVTGWALVIVQGVLTVALGILIAVNGLINCIKMNPHRRARKDAEKLGRRESLITPIEAHNSLLMYPMDSKQANVKSEMVATTHYQGYTVNGADMLPIRTNSGSGMGDRIINSRHDSERSRSVSPVSIYRYEPQLPDVEFKGMAI